MSKCIWQHPEIPADETTVAWRSAGQLRNTPEFREWLEREFPRGAAEMADGEDAETSRRSFMKLMGASTALAGFGMAACRRPEAYILPYANAPEWVIPGKATYYASTFPSAAGATPVVVTTFEGRPTKLGANTLHPDGDGTDSFVQASVLDLYSPSRSRTTLKNGQPIDRAEIEALIAEIAKAPSSKVGIVFGEEDSPSRARAIKELRGKFGNARFYAYEALAGEAPAGAGQRFVADFAKADRIVSLDCDFTELDSVGPVKPFFTRRKPEGENYDQKPDEEFLNRLYSVESAFSLTGGMADHRLRVKPSQLLSVAAALAKAVGTGDNVGSVESLDADMSEWVEKMAKDLPQGRSLVVAGSRTPLAVQLLAASINARLGNIGDDKPLKVVRTDVGQLAGISELVEDLNGGKIETLILLTPGNPVYDAPADLNFKEALIKAKQSIHVGERTNATAHACTYHLPASHYLESWSDTRTANGVYSIVQPMIYPLYEDCVSELELLSALLSDDGTLVAGEVADGSPSPAYTYLRETFAGLAGEGEEKWKKLLHDGYHAGSKYDAGSFSPDASALSAAIAAAPKGGGVELIFASDASVWDGRWIDNGWLQEAPDPQSKVTWDNVALVSPKTAKRLGIYDEIVKLEPIGTTMYGIEAKNAGVGPDKEGEHRTGALIKLTVGGKTVEVPAQIGFGQADDTIIVPLGYGQGFDQEDELGRTSPPASHVGQVGVNSGFDVYPLRDSKHSYFVALDEDPAKTGKRYSLACTQEHHSMYGRALAREVSTLENKKSHKDFQQQLASVKKQGMDSHMPPNVSLYKQEDRDGQPLISDKIHQWAMSIDLSACTGCNACLVACQAENNIPIVGKEQVAMGREMHWIRMDRYFAAQPVTDDKGKQKKEGDKYLYDEDNPSMVPQPVACVQCESAPCETVCPVNATVHTEDGLNAMAYNRCIGTRYCANNCPYKARRFNFFDYNKRNPLVAHNLYRGPLGEKQVGTAPHLQRNPNVSVRMRGVMEKCTYCVQRLKDATIRQKRRQKQEALANGDSAANTVTVNTLRIPVDSVKVACQDACSSGAIAFGNLLDEEKSRMVRAKGVGRNYDLLQYIGTIPRTSYLARVKNPNKDMPGAHSVGRSTINMH